MLHGRGGTVQTGGGVESRPLAGRQGENCERGCRGFIEFLAVSERHQFLLERFRGRRWNIHVVLEGDAGVAALVLAIALDVGTLACTVDCDHVVADMAFKFADGDGAGRVGDDASGDEMADAVGLAQQGIHALFLGIGELDVAKQFEGSGVVFVNR